MAARITEIQVKTPLFPSDSDGGQLWHEWFSFLQKHTTSAPSLAQRSLEGEDAHTQEPPHRRCGGRSLGLSLEDVEPKPSKGRSDK